MTGSPSKISHVTTAELTPSSLMVTLSGADSTVSDREKRKVINIHPNSSWICEHSPSLWTCPLSSSSLCLLQFDPSAFIHVRSNYPQRFLGVVGVSVFLLDFFLPSCTHPVAVWLMNLCSCCRPFILMFDPANNKPECNAAYEDQICCCVLRLLGERDVWVWGSQRASREQVTVLRHQSQKPICSESRQRNITDRPWRWAQTNA